MSRTMSTVCSISAIHWDPSLEHTGRTSIAILCHEASNSLCPSKRLETPAFPLQGRSFRNGVKFSVQTTSRGKLPWRRWSLDKEMLEWSPVGLKAIMGLVVLVESIKLREAQNKPDKALLRVIHRANALVYPSTRPSTGPESFIITLWPYRLPPMPKAQPQCRLLWNRPMALRPTIRRPICQCWISSEVLWFSSAARFGLMIEVWIWSVAAQSSL